jgi:hypothetical protein
MPDTACTAGEKATPSPQPIQSHDEQESIRPLPAMDEEADGSASPYPQGIRFWPITFA